MNMLLQKSPLHLCDGHAWDIQGAAKNVPRRKLKFLRNDLMFNADKPSEYIAVKFRTKYCIISEQWQFSSRYIVLAHPIHSSGSFLSLSVHLRQEACRATGFRHRSLNIHETATARRSFAYWVVTNRPVFFSCSTRDTAMFHTVRK